MENNIIELLDLKDDNLIITNIQIIDGRKIVHAQKKLRQEYCPICSSRMHSRGVYKRTINHPILQDGYQLQIILSQRKWKCTNTCCNHICNDEFNFVEKFKQSTNLTPYMILYHMKDLHVTAVQAAQRFHVSDTYVHYTFMQYIDLGRLPLPRILSIDEVFLEFDNKNRYCLVLMDFVTGEIVDILPNRYDKTTSKYFLDIPINERNSVEYIVCDMYNPYVNYTMRYFRKAKAAIDSFHVISWLNNKLNQYINTVKKKYQKRDKEQLEQKNYLSNKEYKTTVDSKEVYLLNNYKWVLLQNPSNIKYSHIRKLNKKLGQYMDTYDYIDAFLSLDDDFGYLRDLKNKYLTFNSLCFDTTEELENEFDQLVNLYSSSRSTIFKEFSALLIRYKPQILTSFTKVIRENNSNKREEIISRLSNGPIEGFNRAPKDLKRNSRGFTNFSYTRNRILWANRENAKILAVPKSIKSVHVHTEKIRGKYKKQ